MNVLMGDEKVVSVLNFMRGASIAYQMRNNITTTYITEEVDFIDYVSKVCCVVRDVVNSSERLFSVKDEGVSGGGFINANGCGNSILWLMRGYDSLVRSNFKMHRFHPVFEMFYLKLMEHGLRECVHDFQYCCGDDAVMAVDLLNGFVDDVRFECRSKLFKESIRRYYRSADENYKELMKCIHALMVRYKKLLVLRMDYGYIKPDAWPVSCASVDYIDFRNHRDVLLKNTNKRFYRNLVGYAWRIEYGMKKSFQIHVVYFFQGCHQEDGDALSRRLGDFWSSDITNGEGLYYDCSNFLGGCKRAGTGVINIDDIRGEAALKDAALYMTKSDYLIRFSAPDGGRSFGKCVAF